MNIRTAAAIAVVLGITETACQDNWQSFFIHDNKKLGDPPGCEIPTDETAEGLMDGVLDVGLRYSYAACLFGSNALIAREDYGLPRAESNGIFVQGAYIYVEPDPTTREWAYYPPTEIHLSTYISPQGHWTMCVPILPWSVGAAVADDLTRSGQTFLEVVVTVQLYGETQSGTAVLTQEFQYPIWVCRGCLQMCPNDADSLTPGCQCPVETPDGDLPCIPGQDFGFDICLL